MNSTKKCPAVAGFEPRTFLILWANFCATTCTKTKKTWCALLWLGNIKLAKKDTLELKINQ